MFKLIRNLLSPSATADLPAPPVEVAPDMLQADGLPPFAVRENLTRVEGLPHLNWQAVRHWCDAAADRAATDRAWAACERAWLLHLRDALGTGFRLHESEAALLLSSLEPRVARVTLDYVRRTAERIVKLLDGIAEMPPGGKDLLIVFDDEDSYYRYVAHFYPEEGEFGFSGGMFLAAGCGHFVTRKAELAALEPVIAHEMTHSLVAHLPLPAWLNEGLAVNTERKLAGSGESLYSPRELRDMHREFWTAATVQEYWSGAAFSRPDEGQLLAYDLARLMVEQLARDWVAFRDFTCAATHDDAGDAAARTHLGLPLGQMVGVLLELPADARWEPTPARWPGSAEARGWQG